MEQEKINFYSENTFSLEGAERYPLWIQRVITSEGKKPGELSYIFCDDHYLLELNQEYLQHDTLTDIITFDYSVGQLVQGDIYISIERVKENAQDYNVDFEEELRRVMIHGIMHLCGYKDKTEEQSLMMRQKEEEKMTLFHVEQS